MTGIYESLRQKELELQRALNSVAEANEREMRRVQRLLQDALAAINQLLGSEAVTAESEILSSLPTSNVTPIESRPIEKKVVYSSTAPLPAVFEDTSLRQFP